MPSLVDYVFAASVVKIATSILRQEERFVPLEDLAARLKRTLNVEVSDEIIWETIDRMKAASLVEVIEDEITDYYYKIEQDGFLQIYNESVIDKSSLIYRYAVVGQDYLEKAVSALRGAGHESNIPDGKSAPASDRIVSLSDNSEFRDQVIGMVSDLSELIRADNDPDGKISDVRPRLISELSASEELLKAPTVRLKALWAVLGAALAFIAKEFAGGAIGQLAGDLLEQLRMLLGL